MPSCVPYKNGIGRAYDWHAPRWLHLGCCSGSASSPSGERAHFFIFSFDDGRNDLAAIDSMTKQKYLAIWAAFAFLPIAIVAFTNYLVDPFQYFRVSHPPRFSNLMQR